ncbi:MAG: ABC transporter permease, partial [Gemmatimonadaceae bacterium]
MPIAVRIASLARNLLRRDRVERDLDAELGAYVDLLCDEKIAAGMTHADARRTAIVESGGVTQVKEEVRDARAGALLDGVMRDVRYGARSLARTPGFTIGAALALALGIGANAAVFSVADAVLLRPLPYRDADALVTILHHGRNPVAPANFIDWRRQSSSFSHFGAADYWQPNITGTDAPERILALKISDDVLPMLGVPPMLGRFFSADEQQRGRDHVAVLGYGLWQRRFAGDRGIVGKTITVDGDAYTVVGVMPRQFRFAPYWATKAELWAPLALGPRETNRGGQSLRIFARLKPGVTFASARAVIGAITARLEAEFPGSDRD